MCRTRDIISPSGILYKKPKIADPLGLTNTAVGDPTGRIRRTKAQIAREEAAAAAADADAKNVYPNALLRARADAEESTERTRADRLRRRSAYGVSLLGASYSNSLLTPTGG